MMNIISCTNHLTSQLLNIIPLIPYSEADYKTFKDILIDKSVIFTSSWMNKLFNFDEIKKFVQQYGEDNLKEFFQSPENDLKLQDRYKILTKYNLTEKLGYYKITTEDNQLIGGCALIPLLIENNKIIKVDVGLHILQKFQKNKIGETILPELFDYSFNIKNIKNVVGTALKTNYGTSTLCAKYGMIITTDNKNSNIKYFHISDKMWKEVKKDLNIIDKQSALNLF